MLPERVDDSGPKNGSLELPPSIRSPVHQPRHEIHQQLSNDESYECGHGSSMVLDGFPDQEVPEIETEGEVGGFPEAEVPGVVILPQLLLAASLEGHSLC